jgi:hypothetical protein
MTGDPILVLAWLVLAHLLADFVLQTDAMVADKTAGGSRTLRGLAAHGLIVAICLVPFPLAYGVSGLWVLLVIALSHVVIDWTKVGLSRRAEAVALLASRRRHEGRHPAASLGRAWTPVPAGLFALDQAAHLAVLAAAWAIALAGASLTDPFVAVVDRLTAGRDLAVVHDVTLGLVVLVSLAIVNVKAGALFVATLVRPLEVVAGSDEPSDAVVGAPTPAEPPQSAESSPPAEPKTAGWRLRLGPIDGSLETIPATPAEPASGAAPAASVRPPAAVGATIGIIERLLIVALMLTGAEAAIGLVIAAKTLARFKQLDDRDFAEYYLLGTLGSVAVAVGSALLAQAALAA